jgi:hypothetical protein
MESYTDCRSEEGVTVGLIDGMIAIARVLAKRKLDSEPIKQALIDLRLDEDMFYLYREFSLAPNEHLSTQTRDL